MWLFHETRDEIIKPVILATINRIFLNTILTKRKVTKNYHSHKEKKKEKETNCSSGEGVHHRIRVFKNLILL